MNTYDSAHTFYGGSTLFVQYHDVVKPIYLTAVLKLLYSKDNPYGLQTNLIKDFSLFSILEWYVNRSFINPLKLLDPAHKATDEQLNTIMKKILQSDPSLYTSAPYLNAEKLIAVIRLQKLGIPIIVYTEEYEEPVTETISHWSNTQYLYGNFEQIISKLPNNSSFIFSDINLAKRLIDASNFDTIASVMIASDYYYNFKDKDTYKYDFVQEMIKQQKMLFKFKSISLFNYIEVIKSLGENKKEC